MLRIFPAVFLLLGIAFSQEESQVVAQDSTADSMTVDLSGVDSVSSSIPLDSAGRQNWISQWWGSSRMDTLNKVAWKVGDYDAINLRFPIYASVKDGKFEFDINGFLPMQKEIAEKFKKSKGFKTQVLFHDREIRLQPKKKESRYVVIDQVNLLWDTLTIPVLAEIWIPQKIESSLGFQSWRDSLVLMGNLLSATRSWWNDPASIQKIPMLRFGNAEWMSRYVSIEAGFSYPCAPNVEFTLCRKYSRDALDGLCPEGMDIPDTAQIRNLINVWHGGSDASPNDLPFHVGFLAWLINESDSTVKDPGVMVYTPWSGNGKIEPHFWSYMESYAKDSTGNVGLFQLAWSESGWMSEFDNDPADRHMHPLRCVHSLIAPPVTAIAPLSTDSTAN